MTSGVRAGKDGVPQSRVTRRTAGDVDDGIDSLRDEEFTGSHTAPSGMTHDIHGHRATEHVEIVRYRSQRHVHCTGYVTFTVLVGFTNVDDGRTSLQERAQLTCCYLSNHHDAPDYRSTTALGSIMRSLTFTTVCVSTVMSSIRKVFTARCTARSPRSNAAARTGSDVD